MDFVNPQNMRFLVDQTGDVCRFCLGDYEIREVGWVLWVQKRAW